MVALPKKWVKQIGLRQGSEVTIMKLNSSTLMVNAQPGESQARGREGTIEVLAEESAETVFRKVVSLYVLGFSRIGVEGTRNAFGPGKKAALKNLVRRHLIGTEAVAEQRDRMAVHVLLGYSELSVEGALKKMLLLIDALRRDAASAFETDDGALADSATERQEEVGRFGLYVIRQLNLSLNEGVLPDLRLENRDTLGYILVARILERIAHHVNSLTRSAVGVPGSLPMPMKLKLTSMSETACGLVDEALLSLFKRDYEGADRVVTETRAFIEREVAAVEIPEGNGQAYYTAHVLMDAQRRIAEYAREVAEVVLDMTVERTLRSREPEAAFVSTP